MDFHLQSQRLVLYGWEKILQGKYCWLVPDLILSIICGHVLILFFGCFVFYAVLKKKKFQKHWKISKRQKYFILCLVLFFLRITWIKISLSWFRTCLTLWRNLNSICYISTNLFLTLCGYVLICTCTQGLICVSSIA